MVKSSIAVHDLRRSLFKPIVCCVGQIPLFAAAVKSGNDGHDENRRDALNWMMMVMCCFLCEFKIVMIGIEFLIVVVLINK